MLLCMCLCVWVWVWVCGVCSSVLPVLCHQELAASRSDAYASLTGRARQLALEEFKAEMSGAWPAAAGQHQQMTADGDAAENESESSMPCSLPSDVEATKNKR